VVGRLSRRQRIGVLISGRGSNLGSLISATHSINFPAEISLVISNNPNAPGLAFAARAGIASKVINHRTFTNRPDFETAMTASLENAGVELVCNAGFMRLLTAKFVEHWRNRQLNIHPSLLPAYRGLHTHERVLKDGARVTGCSVHFVRQNMDEGPIVAQAAVPVLSSDDAETLSARVLKAEHQLYPHALRLVASGQVRVEGEKVVGSNGPAAAPLFSPSLDIS
jgi:phosphoribosylglycinamide formyltransferase-1